MRFNAESIVTGEFIPVTERVHKAKRRGWRPLDAVIGEIRFKSWGFKMRNLSNEEKPYDFLVVGAGAAASVLAAELSSGAQLLVIESGKPDHGRSSRTRAVVEFVDQIVDLEQEMKSRYLASGSYGRINVGGN